MFKEALENFILDKFSLPIEDLKQEFITSGYIFRTDKKRRGVCVSHFNQYNALFEEVLCIGDTANINKAMVLSKYGKYQKEADSSFIIKIKDESLLTPPVLEAINFLRNNMTNFGLDLQHYKLYRNSTSYFSDISDKPWINNIFINYIYSFGSSIFLIKQQHKYLLSKISNIIENQFSSLPLELSYTEEMKILNKISEGIIKKLTENKKTPAFIISQFSSSSNITDIQNNTLDYSKKITYIDIMFKKSVAISKYIIPFLINKVKLSNTIIERFVVLCQQHLLDNISAKLIEQELDISLLSPFSGRTIFNVELGNGYSLVRGRNLFNLVKLSEPTFNSAPISNHTQTFSTPSVVYLNTEDDEIPF